MNPGSTFYFKLGLAPTDSCEYSPPSSHTSNFDTPAIPNHTLNAANVMGYALGSNGLPMVGEGVSIQGNYTGGSPGCATADSGSFSFLGVAAAAANGSYVIPDPLPAQDSPGLTCYLTGWSAWADAGTDGTGWVELWKVSSEPNSADGWNWQTFYLNPATSTTSVTTNSDSGQNGVYSELAFVHTTNAGCTVNEGYSIENSVYAYLGGTGGSDSYAYSASSTFPGPGSPSDNGESPAISQQYTYYGAYEINPDGGVSIVDNPPQAGAAPLDETSFGFYDGSDPVSAPPAVSVTTATIVQVAPRNTLQQSFEAYGTLTFQFGVDISVGVSVGIGLVSVSVSTNINFGVSGTQSTFGGVVCTLGNVQSTAYQYFELYAQGGDSYAQGVEYHIWQCEPGIGGGFPSSCSAIDPP
ncbi:MAG: hypothetical protein ACREBZ_01970 [Thermoplasmata archaeon]